MSNATLNKESTCPDQSVLEGMLNSESTTELTEHVGSCEGCQKKLEDLATKDTPELQQALLDLPKTEPPKDSAYWHALSKAEQALTEGFADPPLSTEIKLDFLSKTSTPGRLGRISTFDVKRVIGRGGMGVVLQAFDPSLHRDVAIKVLDPQLASNDVARQRFCREARAAAAVSHDNLVTIYQVDEDSKSGLPFLVMQLVTGESLEQRLKRVGKLSVVDAVRIGMQSAAGLANAHQNGLIHRDIKPGNILLENGTEKAKLTDFGLARAAEDMKLTRTGFVAGTPLYMAPEQARGDEIDARADLFSLGSVMYETLAGKPPFEGRTPLAVLRRVADEAHEPLVKLNPDVPEWLEDTIDRLLAKEPSDRFQTAQELTEFLAVKYSAMKSNTPLSSPVDMCAAPTSSRRLSRVAKKAFCVRTASMLATVFGVGLVIGAVATWLFAPPQEKLVEKIVTQTVTVNSAGVRVDTGIAPETTLSSRSGAIWAVAMSVDGTLVASGIESGRINIWEVATKRLLYELHPDKDGKLSAHTGPIWAIHFSKDLKTLISAADDGTIKTWDLETGILTKSFPLGIAVRTAAVSPDGVLIAVGDRQGYVQVVDILHEEQILRYEQGNTVNTIAFTNDGKSLASASTDGRVIVWDVEKKFRRFSWQASESPIYNIAFSHDGERMATAGWDRVVNIWNIKTLERIGEPIAHDEGVWSVQFSSCGRILATAGQDGKAKVFDVDGSNKLLKTFIGHKGPIHSLRFSSSGHQLITGGRDGSVNVWDSVCK
jgi:eukaryotic-like serine/threonine-protein kinase